VSSGLRLSSQEWIVSGVVVSVVIPSFNGMPYLAATVQSVLDQSYSDLQIVISDGGSTDDTLAYLATINDPRVSVIHCPLPGAAANWTYACAAATGEFTKLVCQDDLLYPHNVAEQVEQLIREPGAVMAISSRDIINAHGKVIYRNRGVMGLPAGLVPGIDALRASYHKGTNILGEPFAVLFRTSELQQALPWDDSAPLMLDLAMYQRVLDPMTPKSDPDSRFVVVGKTPVGAFRVSSHSWSTRIAEQQVHQFRYWQKSFEATEREMGRPLTSRDQTRAFIGRHVEAAKRRSAYKYLRLRRTISNPETG